MEQLKPCPFCGGRATIQQDTRYPRYGKRDTVRAFTPVCTNYECLIYKADNVYFASEKKAIAAWNSRAEPTDLEKMREACSKCPARAKLEAEIEEIMSESE